MLCLSVSRASPTALLFALWLSFLLCEILSNAEVTVAKQRVYICDAKQFCTVLLSFFPGTFIYLFSFLFFFLLLGILGEDALLPAPQNISILSTNMKHFLTWSPVIVQGETVRYSVEFQG